MEIILKIDILHKVNIICTWSNLTSISGDTHSSFTSARGNVVTAS